MTYLDRMPPNATDLSRDIFTMAAESTSAASSHQALVGMAIISELCALRAQLAAAGFDFPQVGRLPGNPPDS